MSSPIILASMSEIRQQMLSNAGLIFTVEPAKIDEDTIMRSLQAEGARPIDIADALAEFKARKISDKHPGSLVIGCDQVLQCDQQIFAKASSVEEAKEHLKILRGKKHKLLSAVVIYEGGEPKWRHVGQVSLTMRAFSDAFMEDYLKRNWESIQHAVGCYKLEEEGVRLFSRVEGDYFTVLGLPLLDLLSYLTLRGVLPK